MCGRSAHGTPACGRCWTRRRRGRACNACGEHNAPTRFRPEGCFRVSLPLQDAQGSRMHGRGRGGRSPARRRSRRGARYMTTRARLRFCLGRRHGTRRIPSAFRRSTTNRRRDRGGNQESARADSRNSRNLLHRRCACAADSRNACHRTAPGSAERRDRIRPE